MKNNNIVVNALCLGLMGLVCFGAMGDVAYASTAQRCPVTPITVVNQSLHSVVVQGQGDPVIIPPKASIATTVQSKYFYTRCGFIQLGLNPTAVKSGLIDTKAKDVQIRINPDDRIEQLGMTSQGFELDDYISWHGYKEVLE